MGLRGKKIIIRIDDIGYTEVCNMGAFKTLESGIATAADVMLDCPGTEDALRRLREFPYISIGWHTHFWGSPVLPISRVPTLVDETTGHFKQGLEWQEAGVDEQEMYAELKAQIQRCIDILGKVPDTGYSAPGGLSTAFTRAMAKVNEEYDMAHHFQRPYPNKKNPVSDDVFLKKIQEMLAEAEKGEGDGKPKPPFGKANFPFGKREVDACWKDTYITLDGNFTRSLGSGADSIREYVKTYDPVRAFLDDEIGLAQMDEKWYMGYAFHPGYMDDYMYFDGDPGEAKYNFMLPRLVDIRALCSDKLKQWIAENGIILSSFTDALYCQNHYQQHLKEIGSPLCQI